MNYILVVIVLALLGGGAYYYFEVSQKDMDADSMQESETMDEMSSDTDVPEGYHRMPDGSLMKNEDMEEGDDMNMSVDVSLDASVNVQTFDVSGRNFAFSTSEIRVNKGDTVTINFTSTDGFHDWVVDEFDAATARVDTGGQTSVTFVADKAGTYEFYCSVGSHRAQGMTGTLIVE